MSETLNWREIADEARDWMRVSGQSRRNCVKHCIDRAICRRWTDAR